MRVAFPGEPGAFSEEAIVRLWNGVVAEPVPTRSPADVAAAVTRGDVDAGILPVENTVAGSVVASYDVLAANEALHAVAEVVLPIRQLLLAATGATLGSIEIVESHPVALAQCARFLDRHPNYRTRVAPDTASAAQSVAEARSPHRAAIASQSAAQRYGLVVLAEDVQDRPDNQTRFLAVRTSPATLEPGRPARTSLVFTTRNEPGALLRALTPIAERDLSLSKLESRPTGEPWTYRFFADFDHAAGDPRRDDVLTALRAATLTLRVIGTYQRYVS